MDSYVFNQTGDGNVQIGDMTGMPYQVSTALKWALEHNFQSVAAQYSKTLALEVVRLREESERTNAELKSARKRAGEMDDQIAALRAENDEMRDVMIRACVWLDVHGRPGIPDVTRALSEAVAATAKKEKQNG